MGGRRAGRSSTRLSPRTPPIALVEACDEIEELLGVREDDAELTTAIGDLMAALKAARETADRIERGEAVDPATSAPRSRTFA